MIEHVKCEILVIKSWNAAAHQHVLKHIFGLKSQHHTYSTKIRKREKKRVFELSFKYIKAQVKCYSMYGAGRFLRMLMERPGV